MTHRPFAITAIAFLCSTAPGTTPPVTFESPCECRYNHGKGGGAVKNDPSTPPTDASAIQAVTPNDVFSWPGPDVHLTGQSERTGIENKWFALTGRVVALKVEADGIFTSRFKMRPETNRGLLSVKYQANRSGVQFVKRFLAGRIRDFLFTLALLRSGRSINSS